MPSKRRKRMYVVNIAAPDFVDGEPPNGKLFSRVGLARSLKFYRSNGLQKMTVLIPGRSWREGDDIFWKWGLK